MLRPRAELSGADRKAVSAGGWRLRRISRAAPLAVLAPLAILIGILLRLDDPSALSRIRMIAYDGFQNWHPRTYDPDLPVRIVTIDETSLRRLGQWPWPRAKLAELAARLGDLGAASIGFDLILSEPDRLSRDEIVRQVPDGPGRQHLMDALADLKDGDNVLAEVVALRPAVLGVVLGTADEDAEGAPDTTTPAGFTAKAGFAFAGDDPAAFLPGYEAAGLPLPVLAQAAAGLGALNWVPGRDQVVRDVPLLFHLQDGTFVPSLAAEVLRIAVGASTYVVRASNASGQNAFGEQTGVNAIRIGPFEVPTTPSGAILVHFTPTEARRQIPAWKVFEGLVDPDEVAGRIVFVGATASGLFDLQATPLDVAISGVDIHAQVVEAILSGAALKRPDWAAGFEIVLFAGLTLAFTLLAALASPLPTLVVGLATLSAVFAGSYLAFVRVGVFIDPSFPVVGSAFALFGAIGIVAVRERADRRWLRQAFGRYVSDSVVDIIVRDPDRLVLGGELRDMTVLFADIRNFTTCSEGMSAPEVTNWLNAYLTAMSEVILRNGGMIDKFMGDAIMAFWNAPVEDPRHAARACAAALQMQEALAAFNRGHEGRYPVTAIGIGINTGTCCVGNLGSRQRFDYSVIGDDVNIASRLEGLTRIYGVPILVGARTAAMAELEGYVFAPVDRVQVKGRAGAVDTLTLLGGPSISTNRPSSGRPLAVRDRPEGHYPRAR